MHKRQFIVMVGFFIFVAAACDNPVYCSLASDKAHCKVNKDRMDNPNNATTPTIEDNEEKLFADLSTIAKEKDQEKLGEAEQGSTRIHTTDTPTSTLAPPSFIPDVNAYCRAGPDISHNSLGTATKGQAYPIEGRNSDWTWYLIRLSEKITCWISASTGKTSGDTSRIRLIQNIPTPVPTLPPDFCGQFTTPQTCAQHPECIWNRSATPAVCQAK